MKMIKTSVAGLMASLAIVLTACSADPETSPVAADGTVPVEIRLDISIDPKVNLPGASRSGIDDVPRIITDWQGAQAVNDLRIYVFSSTEPDGKYVYYGGGNMPDGSFKCEDFSNEGIYTGTNASDKGYNQNFETHEFVFKPHLATGRYYKFLAVGRDDREGMSIPTSTIAYVPWGTRTMDDPHLLVGVTDIHDVVITDLLSITKYPYVCTEIFTGMMKYTDQSGQVVEDYVHVTERMPGFDKKIELSRAVAGLYIYLTDIPTKAIDNSGSAYNGLEFDPDEVTLYMTYATNTLNLTTFPYSGGQIMHNIQVGYADLRNYYGEYNIEHPWYKVAGDNYWHRDRIEDYHGATVDANCLLLTNFLIPFDPTELLRSNESTFTLQLRQQESDYTLTKQMKCRIVTMQNPATGESEELTYDPMRFPVMPNMLYSLGTPSSPLRLGQVIK